MEVKMKELEVGKKTEMKHEKRERELKRERKREK